jgi:predicted MFS family arabinose efflux permease
VMALGLIPIGSLVGGVLIDTIGGTGTLFVLGAALCVVALVFSQVRGLRAASLAPPSQRGTEPVLPMSEGIEV